MREKLGPATGGRRGCFDIPESALHQTLQQGAREAVLRDGDSDTP